MAGPKAQFDADFAKFVSELTKVDVKLRDFDATADRSSARLQRMADSLNGHKLVEQASVAAAAIGKIDGGVRALNEGELRRYGALIDGATEKLLRQGRDVPPALAQVKTALDEVRRPVDALTASADKASSAFGDIGRSMAGGLGLGAGLSAFGLLESGLGLIRDQIGDVITLGDEYARLNKGFTVFQGGASQAEAALEQLRASTRGMVADSALMLAANQASVLKLHDLGVETADVARVATRLGAALGQDATKSINDMTTALARGSFEILDNLGISLRLSEAHEAFAPRLGKTADQLTDLEKKQAFATIALERGREVVDKLGEDALTAGQQVDRLGVAFTNLKGTVGAGAAGGGALADFLGGVADAAARVVDDVTEAKKALNELKALMPGGDRIDVGLLGRGAGEVAIGMSGVWGAARAGAGVLAVGRDAAQDFGLVAPDLPADRGGRVDLASLVPPAIRTTFTEKELAFAGTQVDAALDKVKRQNERIDQLAKERRRKLDDLLGRDDLQKGTLALEALKELGMRTPSNEVATQLFGTLLDGRTVATSLEPGLVGGFDAGLKKLAGHPAIVAASRQAGQKIVDGLLDPSRLSARVQDSVAGLIGPALTRGLTGALPASTSPDIIGRLGAGGSALGPRLTEIGASELTKLAAFGVPLDEITRRFDTFISKTQSWRLNVVGVSQAFANLSQVAGDLDPLTRSVGTLVTGLSAAEQLVTSVGGAFDKDFAFGNSRTGQNVSSGIAGGLMGWQIGTGAGLSPWRSAGLGALGGGAAGVPYAAATGGASIAVGAVAGAGGAFFGAQKAQSELRKAKDLQAEALVAQYGTLDALLETVGALGLSQESFLGKYYGEPKAFAQGVNDLNNALTREKNTADALADSFLKVQEAQGLLSRSDRALLVRPREGGPLEDLAAQFRTQQTDSLLGGLDRILQQEGPLSASLVAGVGQSLPAALAALEQQGASPLTALKTLMPLLDQFREKAVLAGAGSAPGFDALNSQLALLKDERLGPLIERASGAGQALGALSNLELLDDEMFAGFADAITATVDGMDLLSDQGQTAMRLIRGPLQNVWQLQQDFGLAIGESTDKLLEQAKASGLIGDKFRPTEEKFLQGIDRVAVAAETLVDIFGTTLVDDATAGAELAGRNILDAFDRVRPRVRVEYEYSTPPSSLPPVGPVDPATRETGAGAEAVRRATESSRGGDIYLDGERVGYHTLRHAGDFADLIGA